MKTDDGSVVAGRTGQMLGAALSVIWLFILLASLIAGDEELTVDDEEATIEGILLTVLALAAIIGFVLSLRWTRPGGLLVLLAGCLLCVFAAVTAGRNQWLAVLVSGVPWIIVGSLTLLAGRRPPATAIRREVGDGTDAV